MPIPRPTLLIRLKHTGFYADGRVNPGPVQIADLDVGYEYQTRKVPVYVPPGGSIDINASSRSMLSYEQGGIAKFTDAGIIDSRMFYIPESYTTGTLPLAADFPQGTFVWNSTESQAYWSDGSSWIAGSSPTGAAGGDLSGTYPNPTVSGIEGYPLAPGLPNNGDTLLFNSLTVSWQYGPIVFGGGPPVGPAGGDLGGLYPNPGVTGLQSDPLPIKISDGFIKRNSANTAWEEVPYGVVANTVCEGDDTRLSDSRTPTGAAGGDLTGTYPNPTLIAVGTAGVKGSSSAVPVFTTDSKGRVTANTNTSIQIAESQVTNLVTDLGLKADKIITISAGAGLTGGGDLSANRTLSMPNVGTAATYGSSTQVPVFTTDAQGRVSSVTNTTISGTTPGGAAGGDLTGTYPNPSIAALAVTDAKVAVANKDGLATVPSMRTLGTGATQACSGNDSRLSDSRTPTGSAGGDLTGTYPNPSVDGLQGYAVSATAPNAGEALIWSGSAWTPTAGSGAAFTPKLGNVLLVDDINGNDLTGVVNGRPFKTVGAAITYINTHTLTGVTIWIMPGIYNLTTGITIPDTCSLRGLSTQTCTLQMLGVSANTSLVTMGENSRIEDLNLKLTSNGHYTLKGLVFAGTTCQTAKVRTCVVTVDNSSASTGGTSNVYGVEADGIIAYNPSSFSFNAIRGTTINVKSNGGGNKRGIYQPTASQFSTRDVNIYIAVPTDSASTGSYVGVETASATGQIQLRTTVISGAPNSGSYTGSDILQTLPALPSTTAGIQVGPGTDLVTSTAGGKSFSCSVYPTTIIFGLNGPMPNGTRYLWPGVITTADNSQTFYRVQQSAVLFGMNANMRGSPGAATLTVNVLRSATGVAGSGVPTSMTMSLTAGNTQVGYYGSSEDFATGEFLCLQLVSTGNINPADITIQLDMF